ncbi:MAG: M28 family peptidase [Chthonomonadales bacterium]|nr:M28 family peptidase [Chthonomonadales bacterium]
MSSASRAGRARALGLGLAAACGLLTSGCRARAVSATGDDMPAAAKAAPERLAFDREAAWKHLVGQCEFGPRVPGTEAHARARQYFIDELKGSTDRVVTQDFRYDGVRFSNVIGLIRPEARKQVLLCAHWDTRPRADMEIDEARKRRPIPGANDGASGVAVLLELARVFHARKPDVGVVIALFDGEDYGDFERDTGVFLGSRHFARTYRALCRPAYGVLLDMVGDKDLTIYRERNSDRYARDLNDRIFAIARELRHGAKFVDEPRYAITDDHIPLNRAGIPSVDLIDFDYAYWHTLDDTPDRCSPESLAAVGETLAALVYREKPVP